MKFLLLILGLILMIVGYKIFKSNTDIINTQKESSTKGASSLFEQIVNDDFEDSK